MASIHPNDDTSSEQRNAKIISPIKHYFLYVLIGGLIISALISIVAVLLGEFSETLGRSLATTFVIVVHALIGLTFLSASSQKSLSSKLLINTLFTVVIASLLTAIPGIWGVFSDVLVGDLYGLYFIAVVTVLIVSALLTAHQQDQTTRAVMWGAVTGTTVTFLLIVPYIFADSNYELPEIYGRLTWVFVILSVTLAVLTGIFDRLYAAKHPELKAPVKPGSMPVWLRVLLALIIAFISLPFIVPFLIFIVAGNTYTGY